MADEARLIFELVDRSAGTTAPAPGAPSPGGPQPSGPSDPVGDAGQRNRPATPTPSGPAPASPVAPESPRPVSPTVQPSAQPDSRWGDLVGSLTEIAKSLGLTATLQQTVAGQVLSFGMRAFNAVDRAADALQKFTGTSDQRPAAPGEQGGSRPMPVQPVSPTAVETVQPAPPVQPMPEAPRPVAPEPPERSPYDNGDVIEGTARPAMPDSGSRPALPAPTVPAQPSAGGGAMIPRPSLPAVAGPSAGVPAIPAAAAGAPATGAAGAGAAAAPSALAVAAPVAATVAIVAGAAYAGYRTYDYVSSASLQAASGEVGGLSPDVAQANALQRVRELAANISTANQVGPEIAMNVEAVGQLKAELQGLRDQMIRIFGEDVANITKAMAGVLGLLNRIADWVPGGSENLKTVIIEYLTKPLRDLADERDRARTDGALQDNPLTAFQSLDFVPLPPPFAATDEMPLDQKFNPIPGLEL